MRGRHLSCKPAMACPSPCALGAQSRLSVVLSVNYLLRPMFAKKKRIYPVRSLLRKLCAAPTPPRISALSPRQAEAGRIGLDATACVATSRQASRLVGRGSLERVNGRAGPASRPDCNSSDVCSSPCPAMAANEVGRGGGAWAHREFSAQKPCACPKPIEFRRS
jgi:hypothetical protein